MSLLDVNSSSSGNYNLINLDDSNSCNLENIGIPEVECWLLKPKIISTNDHNHFISGPINIWLREVFDSPDSPLYLHRDNLVGLIDSLTQKVDQNHKVSGLHTSESFPSLISKLPTNELNQRPLPHLEPLHIQYPTKYESLKDLPNKNLMRSTDMKDIQSIARMEEDNLKAQVAALGMRHTGSQSSLATGLLTSSIGGSFGDLNDHANLFNLGPHNSSYTLNQSLPASALATLRYSSYKNDVNYYKSTQSSKPPVLNRQRTFAVCNSYLQKSSALPTLSRISYKPNTDNSSQERKLSNSSNFGFNG